jgi:general secretion pathway protein A
MSAFGVWRLLRTEPAAPPPVVAAVSAPVAETPPVPAEPPPAPLSDLTEILRTDAPQTTATDGGETTNNGAFTSLFAEWGSKYDAAKGRACDQALVQKLQCVFQKGTWAQLRQLNRPAILTLTDSDGNTHQVVLTALNDEAAKIRIGETTHDITIAALSRYWFGEFLILWRPHTREPRALSIGNRDEGVRWLRRSLYTALGQPVPPAGSDTYDEDLAAMVEEFQHQHRLDVDGVAGLQTQVLLDSLTSTAAPLLLSPAKGG